MNPTETLSNLQFLDKYSRYDYNLGRREEWSETIERVVNFLIKRVPHEYRGEAYELLYKNILNHKVTPSMRLLAVAGPAADKFEESIYNCSFLPLETPRDFHDLVLLLGLGVGVGFSVENDYVKLFGQVKDKTGNTFSYRIKDEIESWAESIQFLIEHKMSGNNIIFDYSAIRPTGTPLKTRGGRASGPEPLMEAHKMIGKVIDNRQGKNIRSVDCFDIACHIAGAIVSGGVRRSAMITIFDMNDEDMLKAKSGEWYKNNIQRQYANISSIIDDKLSRKGMYDILQTMHDSGFGEPGIFSRYALRSTAPERRNVVFGMGTNPCGEIALRPRQFCNLSQAIIRSEDSEDDICEKVKVATVIGTIQSSMTNFKNIHSDFKKNCEEERLLGVSLSGIMDNIHLQNEEFLIKLKNIAIETNVEWAKKMGINQSASVTCVKPDGNTSVLFNTSPGIHPRWSPYYIRRIRLQYNNPIAQWLIYSGVKCEPQIGETWNNVKTVVFDFPIKSPDGIDMYQTSATALQQLNVWLKIKKNWTEHNPSVTIHYRKEELDAIKSFCINNQDYLSGVSFLENGHKYEQAPYEEITKEKYEELASTFPNVDFADFWKFETEFDSTSGSQVMACVGGSCLI